MEEKSPLISVVTITFNAAGVITPTLNSLAAQSFRDFEHIVVDGASSDGTPQLIARLSPMSDIISEPDKGLYDAMNKGLRCARGKYVIFMNAGDAFHQADTLMRYAAAISASKVDPDIIFGDTVVVDGSRKVLRPRHKTAPERLDFKSFLNGMLVCHQAFMVRRDIAPEYNLAYRYSADYEWTLRCIRASKPERNINLHTIVTDYLTDGLTDKHHRDSLMERFNIMREYYGLLPTIAAHIRFALHL